MSINKLEKKVYQEDKRGWDATVSSSRLQQRRSNIKLTTGVINEHDQDGYWLLNVIKHRSLTLKRRQDTSPSAHRHKETGHREQSCQAMIVWGDDSECDSWVSFSITISVRDLEPTFRLLSQQTLIIQEYRTVSSRGLPYCEIWTITL